MENLFLSFKKFIEEDTHFMGDVKATIANIPKSHRDLIKNYKIKPENGNTLKNDKEHVGEIDEKKRHIKVASPWNYSRETTFLHEVAHCVYKYMMTPKLKREWKKLIKDTKTEQKKDKDKAKDSLDQNPEEIFCMVYSAVYSKHPHSTYDHDAWLNFIKTKVPK
ncbi:MAG: hypothetical protein DWQ19_10535 [Crenarchaeota archaeon]|nr:MAG: hypothetical protein DWQ19_10535 [Thermoproteota archaeon]